MANTANIQILRSYANSTPTSLLDGQLAYSFKSNTLFIGSNTGVISIGDPSTAAIARSAAANTVLTQAIDVSQNTRMSAIEAVNITQNTSSVIVQGGLDTANANIVLIQNVNTSQNTRLTNIETVDTNQNNSIAIVQGGLDTSNASISLIQGVDVSQNTRLTNIESIDVYQNNNISIVQGGLDTANVNIALNQAVDSVQNTRMGAIESVDSSQNTSINIAQGGLDTANANISLLFAIDNNQNNNTTIVQGGLNTANANIALILGVNLDQNTRLTNIESVNTNQNTNITIVQGGLNSANANITLIQGVNVDQNTRLTNIETVNSNQNTNISLVDTKAQAAYDNSNTKFSSSGGSITGFVNVSSNISVGTTIDFDPNPVGEATQKEGRIFYDKFSKAFGGYNDTTRYIHFGRDVGIRVFNNTGSTIGIASPVFVLNEPSSGGAPHIALADATTAANSEVIGLTQTSIANGTYGMVISQGLIEYLDTTTYTVGQELYLSTTPGQFTTTVPPTPNIPLNLGYIASVSALYGEIIVNIHLMEGKNKTTGAILFARNQLIDQDPETLFWDYNNNSLGIGTNTPAANLHVVGSGLFTGNVTISGNLYVSNAQSITTSELTVGGNTIILNSSVTGTPTTDASIIVNRGTSTNSYVRWDETNDKWVIYNGSGTQGDILDSEKTFTNWTSYSSALPYAKSNYTIGADLSNSINELAKTANTVAYVAKDQALLVQAELTAANANINIVQGGLNTANANIAGILATNLTQNNNITIIQGGLNSANVNIALTQAVDVYQNNNISIVQGGLNTANANIALIFGIDTSQNTRLTNIESVNTNQNSSITLIQAVDVYQNNNTTIVQGGLNTANANIALIQAVDVYQNTNIQFASDKANSSIQNTGSLITTNGTSQVYIANTTASVSNTTGALVVAGGVGIAGSLNVASEVYVSGSKVLTANDLTTITYTANYITMDPTAVTVANVGMSVPKGVYNFGNVASIQTYGDYDTVANTGFYSVNDEAFANGAPGHVEYVGFTGVVDFNRVVLNINYTASSGHTQDIDIYNYDTNNWDTLGTYSGSGNWQQFALGVIDHIPYISSGNVTIRNYHVNSGSSTHRTWIDYVALEKTITGGQGPRGATGATGATGPAGANTNTANALVITNTTASISNTTGAIVSYGGLGVSGNVYADAVYDNGSRIITIAQNAYTQANLSSGGLTSANANIALIQAVDVYQNNNISIVQGGLNTANANISLIFGIDNSQNTRMTAIESVDTVQNSAITLIQAVDVYQNNNVSIVQGGLNTANANIALIFGIDNSQNANTIIVQGGLNSANANIALIQAVDVYQNNNISIVQGGLNTANANISLLFAIDNSQNSNTTIVQGGLNTANANISLIFGIDTSQNTRMSAIETVDTNQNSSITLIQAVDVYQNNNISIVQGGLNSANANIALIQAVDTYQNTRIDAAFTKANTGGSGSSSGYLANAVIFANTTGYLSNVSNLQFYTSNNTLVASNISVPTVYTTSGGIVFPDGTSQATAASGAATDQTARNIANTKTYTFYTNVTPPTSNSAHDLWVNSDTGVMYENFGTIASPIWAEVGPTGVASNTAPGIINATQVQINGNVAVNGPAFSAYAAATLQTITSGSQQKVLFQTEEFDTNNCFTNSTFTPTVPGYYQLNAEVRFDGAMGTGETMIVVWKNGSEYKRGWNASGVQWASNFWGMTVSTLVYANGTTDYFEIYVQQTSGGNLSVTAVNNPAITWFNGCMVRGA